MKLKSLFIILFLAAATSMSAKFVQEIELKDGTILEGYIFKQQPNRMIVFHCDESTNDPKAQYLNKERDYIFRWDELKYIRNSDKSDNPAIDDRVTLKNGSVYVGRIVQQQPGISMKLRLKDSDDIVDIDSQDIKLTEKIPGNDDANLWLDPPYLNQVRLSDDSIREGMIVTQFRGGTLDDSYIELLHASGYRERIFLPDIKEYIITLR